MKKVTSEEIAKALEALRKPHPEGMGPTCIIFEGVCYEKNDKGEWEQTPLIKR